MRLFKPRSKIIQDENGELKKNLAELDCEKAIINDKNHFGRVRNSMMKVLRAKYGKEVADKTLNRINKRIQKNYFGKSSIL
jgi:hypothetical protein